TNEKNVQVSHEDFSRGGYFGVMASREEIAGRLRQISDYAALRRKLWTRNCRSLVWNSRFGGIKTTEINSAESYEKTPIGGSSLTHCSANFVFFH
ncbi:MAG: hypothetical protein ACK58T_08080, partial [Phycisphaerae bacterium]